MSDFFDTLGYQPSPRVACAPTTMRRARAAA